MKLLVLLNMDKICVFCVCLSIVCPSASFNIYIIRYNHSAIIMKLMSRTFQYIQQILLYIHTLLASNCMVQKGVVSARIGYEC